MPERDDGKCGDDNEDLSNYDDDHNLGEDYHYDGKDDHHQIVPDRDNTDDEDAGDGKDHDLDDYHDDGHESGLIMIMMMVMIIMMMVKMIMMMVFCLPMKCFTKRHVRRLHLAGWEKRVS